MWNAAVYSPLKFLQSHFMQVYKLKPCKRPKWKTLLCQMSAVQKAYFYLCHATQFTTNIFCCPSTRLVEKKSITPTLLHLSITHGNLNCHNKVFFQDVSSNSISFLLKWLSRVSLKSRGGIVIQNRWTLNHR